MLTVIAIFFFAACAGAGLHAKNIRASINTAIIAGFLIAGVLLFRFDEMVEMLIGFALTLLPAFLKNDVSMFGLFAMFLATAVVTGWFTAGFPYQASWFLGGAIGVALMMLGLGTIVELMRGMADDSNSAFDIARNNLWSYPGIIFSLVLMVVVGTLATIIGMVVRMRSR